MKILIKEVEIEILDASSTGIKDYLEGSTSVDYMIVNNNNVFEGTVKINEYINDMTINKIKDYIGNEIKEIIGIKPK